MKQTNKQTNNQSIETQENKSKNLIIKKAKYMQKT